MKALALKFCSLSRLRRLRFILPFFVLGVLIFAQPTRDLGTIHPADQRVRVVAFGDFGEPGDDAGLPQVAAAINAIHQQQPFHLGLTLGDNFYPRGVKSFDDPHWANQWHRHYDRLGTRNATGSPPNLPSPPPRSGPLCMATIRFSPMATTATKSA